MIHLTIDGKEITVPKGTTVFKAAQQLGVEIPVFCYQDRMPPFGACRVCLVEVDKMGKLQTSCSLEATEGMVVKTESALAKEGRNNIIEFLLINHPLDCPICDRGGECPLQEHTMEAGRGSSRFYEEKRHFKKPIPLGSVLMLDRERCITCARCTRFGDLVAGDHALEFIDRGYRSEVGTPGGRPVESKFIGNTIMICPVGALTSQVYRFRARPWDNDSSPSTCTLCPVGCSLMLDSRDGEIVRTRAQENREVNDIWLCDKGWFGYEFTDHQNRLQQPYVRKNNELQPATWDEALSLVAEKILETKREGKIAAFGGNPLTLEENFLFQKLYRTGAGVNNLDHRIGMPLHTLDEEGLSAGMEMTIGETEDLSFALLLGLDITEEFPVVWLRLKQAINKGARVQFIGHFAPEVAPHLAKTLIHPPGKELESIREWAQSLESSQKGAVFIGRQYLSMPNRKGILAELMHLRERFPNLKLNIMEGQGNSMGARLAGMHPELGADGVRLRQPGLNYLEVLQSAAAGGWGLLHVAGADPAKKCPKLWEKARANLDFLVVQDLFLTETARQADVVLPTLAYVEKSGSFINIEGRVQPLNPGKKIPDNLLSDGQIFEILAKRLNLPDFARQGEFSGKREWSMPRGEVKEAKSKSDAFAATFAAALFDRGVRMKHNPHVKQLAKEPFIRLHPLEGNRLGIQNGDKVHLSANGGEISAKVKLDERVAEKTVVLPLGFEQVPVQELAPDLLNGFPVEIKKDLENRFLLM